MRKSKIYLIVISSMLLGIVISTTFSYAIAETLMNSKDVYYEDNSSLGFNNVQDAIDGTCTKFSQKIDTFLDKIYPVGSVYISTTLSTVAQVKEALGGEWQAYGNDKVLRGTTTKAEVTGGSDTVTLTVDNLPSHTHSFTPAGSVASTFKGTAVTSGGQSANHTHTFSGTSSTTGNHSHTFSGTTSSNGLAFAVGRAVYSDSGNYYPDFRYSGSGTSGYHTHTFSGTTSTTGNHAHTYSGTTSASSVNHTHSVTAAGTVTSTFTGTASNTGATGGGKSISVQDSYITVYMYKRIS